MVSYLIFSIGAMSELLIYTYFGTRVTAKHEEIAMSLVEANWDTWTGSQRRTLVIMLRQSQRACTISFMNWLPCSEATLRWVVTNSFSLFALFQKLGKKEKQ